MAKNRHQYKVVGDIVTFDDDWDSDETYRIDERFYDRGRIIRIGLTGIKTGECVYVTPEELYRHATLAE